MMSVMAAAAIAGARARRRASIAAFSLSSRLPNMGSRFRYIEAHMTEPLDIEQPDQLIAYRQRGGHLAPGEMAAVRVLAGGVSNRAVLVERSGGESWVLKQALAKLRVAVEWFSSPERIHREALGMRWLARLAPPGATVPLVFEDHGEHILAMAAVPQPHENWKAMLLRGRLDLDHIAQFARLLGTVQRAASSHADIAAAFDDRSFFESLRLEPYYSYTASQVPAAAAFYKDLIAQTRARRITLVHGDYSPKNVLVYQGRLILLDHEVIHYGDPAFDVGFSLTHLLSKAHHVADRREAFAEAAAHYWQVYNSTIGDVGWRADLERWAVGHTLGCLLARVAGRSPLEYLDARERQRQRDAVLALIARPPSTVEELIEGFVARIHVTGRAAPRS
jgi:aminoglycoside phosphotransferase (APT) family kinase protein